MNCVIIIRTKDKPDRYFSKKSSGKIVVEIGEASLFPSFSAAARYADGDVQRVVKSEKGIVTISIEQVAVSITVI